MSPLAIVLASLAALFFLAAGYFAGARLGRAARDALRDERDRALARLDARSDKDLAASREGAELRAWLERVQSELGALSGAVRERQEGAEARVIELARQLAPDGERMARALADARASSRKDLPPLLDRIATEGALRAVLLGDEVGLLLASSSGAEDAEVIAGASSLLLTHADRLGQGGIAAPLAILIHDEADRLTLHRVIRVQDRRYLLTAIGRRETLGLGSLDPAVDLLERVLARDAWSAA